MIRKLVISNGRSERELLLAGSIVVGRDPSCHVSEPDPLLSRRHAEILANANGVSIRDLDSRNGILVNGAKTHEQILLPGDVVQMGHLQLRYVEETAGPSDTLIERSPVRKPLPPEPPAMLPRTESVDRFRPDPLQAPGRWKPEPTPLPGRRTTAPPPPVQPRYPQSHTPIPRGRAAFPDAPPPQPRQQDTFDQTIAARVPLSLSRTPADMPTALDSTILAPTGSGRRTLDETSLGALQGFGTTLGPGHEAFDSALAHLSGLAQGVPAIESDSEPTRGATLVANADLTIEHATPDCADLLGVPGDTLIGDSLADVFVRAVRRAYAQPDAAVSLAIARGPRGTITVTFTLQDTGGTE